MITHTEFGTVILNNSTKEVRLEEPVRLPGAYLQFLWQVIETHSGPSRCLEPQVGGYFKDERTIFISAYSDPAAPIRIIWQVDQTDGSNYEPHMITIIKKDAKR